MEYEKEEKCKRDEQIKTIVLIVSCTIEVVSVESFDLAVEGESSILVAATDLIGVLGDNMIAFCCICGNA
jgi:hypothetical protein